MYILNPADILRIAKSRNIPRSDITVPSSIILTFSNTVLEELTKTYNLQEWKWKGEMLSPYSSSQKSVKGKIEYDLAVFIPPMGASPLAAFTEELIYFGAKNIILVCASWGLGENYLLKGQLHLPSFAIGIDGTSVHYENKNWRIENEPRAFNALTTTLNKIGTNWKEGGVGACEAIYRITPDSMDEFRKKGCISMENGEVATLYSIAKAKKIPIGALLQPYIDLEKGWNISYLDKEYIKTCKVQAHVAVETLKILHQHENLME
ncbi:MAG: hypothetical protein ACFFB5_10090 [Promethearchaeota archaeon]